MAATIQTKKARTAAGDSRRSPGHGPIIAIGGAEERSPEGEILNEFIRSAGGSRARIVVIPTASADPTAGNDYVRIFREMGVKAARKCSVSSREVANNDRVVKVITEATGVFISGGDQERLNALLVGTMASEALRAMSAKGGAIAGTSAGASILSANVMASGDGDSAPRKGMTEMVAGLGLISDVIIDQHFNARGRIGRLLVIFAGSPGLIALGVDENTAAIMTSDGIVRTIGEGSVVILDGRGVYSDLRNLRDGEVISITGCSLHTLGKGRSFDFHRRRVIDLVEEQTAVDGASSS